MVVFCSMLDSADSDMICSSADRNLEEFMEAAVRFFGEVVDNTMPRWTILTFPYKKPWVDKTTRDTLWSRTAAYNYRFVSGNMEECKAASYSVRRMVKEA